MPQDLTCPICSNEVYRAHVQIDTRHGQVIELFLCVLPDCNGSIYQTSEWPWAGAPDRFATGNSQPTSHN